jgi:hypothetical protein
MALGCTERIPNNVATSDRVRRSPWVLDRLGNGSRGISSSGRASAAELGDVKMCLKVLYQNVSGTVGRSRTTVDSP